MINLVIKKNNEWLVGTSNDFKDFTESSKVSKLKDLYDYPGYITLKKYLKDNKSKMDDSTILSNLGAKSVYILNEEISEETDKEKEEVKKIEEQWWRKINPHCGKCKKTCKQSNMVEVILCPDYKLMS